MDDGVDVQVTIVKLFDTFEHREEINRCIGELFAQKGERWCKHQRVTNAGQRNDQDVHERVVIRLKKGYRSPKLSTRFLLQGNDSDGNPCIQR